MAYKNQEEVRQRAEEYTQELQAAGFSAELIQGSFRDYSVKIAVSKEIHMFGNVIIYYSPKKDSYRLGTHELKDQSAVGELETVWSRLGKSPDTDEGKPSEWCLYVDGSWIDGHIGYGVVILKNNQVEQEISGAIDSEDPQLQSIRQVAGELRAVQDGLNWLIDKKVTKVEVFYDYEGIEKWATAEWQAKNPITLAYREFIQSCPIEIIWHKVKSHTGDHWNERADQLAKEGATKFDTPRQEGIDPITELDKVAAEFAQVLKASEIEAEYRGIVNQQFARIVIPGRQHSSRDNILDIYNTKKKHLSPTWHGFPDEELRERAKNIWDDFIHPERNPIGFRSHGNPLALVEYYYEILKPYREFEFDFTCLAEALQQAAKALETDEINVDEIRFNFPKLEKLWLELKEHTNE